MPVVHRAAFIHCGCRWQEWSQLGTRPQWCDSRTMTASAHGTEFADQIGNFSIGHLTLFAFLKRLNGNEGEQAVGELQ